MTTTTQTPAVPPTSTLQTILDKVKAVAALLSSAIPSNVTLTPAGGQILGAIQTVSSVAGGILTIVDPEATIGGFAVSKIIALAGSMAAQAPAAIAAVQAVQAAVDGGQAPTPEQWAAMDAQADAAHAELQAATAEWLSAHKTG